MYAIVEIAGQQFKVAKDQKVFVHRLHDEEGAKVNFDNVLLLDNDGQIQVGAPAIDGAQVSAKILRHLKGDKVIVFKKKRRKGYKKKNGHRQYLSEIQIESIVASGAKKAEKKTEAKAEVKKEEPKKETSKKDDSSAKLSDMTVAELKAHAKDIGLEGYSSLKKAELIEAIENFKS
ncbi:50S ribosomal protein L21 [Flavobacteriaceae bacterium 14752]|uniref:50S ribosomal protein L21 n=1 Tax=Mesohalobacter salilacus TaxID=2491711 RepID=UPI000F641D1D|nr:50S ribosomal protein L21 [Flavobacteriaceae bacterium 14752]